MKCAIDNMKHLSIAMDIITTYIFDIPLKCKGIKDYFGRGFISMITEFTYSNIHIPHRWHQIKYAILVNRKVAIKLFG